MDSRFLLTCTWQHNRLLAWVLNLFSGRYLESWHWRQCAPKMTNKRRTLRWVLISTAFDKLSLLASLKYKHYPALKKKKKKKRRKEKKRTPDKHGQYFRLTFLALVSLIDISQAFDRISDWEACSLYKLCWHKSSYEQLPQLGQSAILCCHGNMQTHNQACIKDQWLSHVNL